MRSYFLTTLLLIMLMCSQPAAAHIALASNGTGPLRIGDMLSLVLIAVAAGMYSKGLFRLWLRAGTGRGIRTWQAGCFYLGIAALFTTVFWPLNAPDPPSLSEHMVQHMILIAVAAPLLALAKPLVPCLLSLPHASQTRLLRWWRSLKLARGELLTHPAIATGLHGLVIWVWHAPAPFNAALTSEIVHIAEHVTFFGSALLFWWALLSSERLASRGFGSGTVAALATLMHTGMLGALLTFAPSPWYEQYASSSPAGLSPLEDQQLAGLIMWIPTSAVYLIAGLALVAIGLENARHQSLTVHR